MINNFNLGILDFNGIPLKLGDSVQVEFVNYMNTDHEEISDSFIGKIIYNKFNCMFMIERDDKIDDESHSDGDNQTYIINHRSMRITVLNSQNDSITTDDEYENVKDILLNYIENLFLIDF